MVSHVLVVYHARRHAFHPLALVHCSEELEIDAAGVEVTLSVRQPDMPAGGMERQHVTTSKTIQHTAAGTCQQLARRSAAASACYVNTAAPISCNTQPIIYVTPVRPHK